MMNPAENASTGRLKVADFPDRTKTSLQSSLELIQAPDKPGSAAIAIESDSKAARSGHAMLKNNHEILI